MKTDTVLLIFEDPHDLENYGTMLKSLGYRTVMFNSLAEGINCLETEDASLVIVGQGTQAFEGRQVLERSLQRDPRIPVLIVARVLDMGCYLEAMYLGASDYLEKPELTDLAWVVETNIRRSGMPVIPAGVTNPVVGNPVSEIAGRNPRGGAGPPDKASLLRQNQGCTLETFHRKVAISPNPIANG